jgi:hypothetical protein
MQHWKSIFSHVQPNQITPGRSLTSFLPLLLACLYFFIHLFNICLSGFIQKIYQNSFDLAPHVTKLLMELNKINFTSKAEMCQRDPKVVFIYLSSLQFHILLVAL